MTDLPLQNQSFYRCTIFFRELYERGVRHIVISPGSRSTPLTLAAAAHPGLKKHVVLDERSAAFTALGIGKATGKPALLICTSGTAAANYFPAVIEAKQSGVPLILATADRPSHLRNTDANQTIDQLDLYGKFAVSFRHVDSLETGQNTNLGHQACHIAVDRQGPVHLNFSFDKPLEPEPEFLEKIQTQNESAADNSSPVHSRDQVRSFRFDDDILYRIHECERTLIIVGQLATSTPLEHVFWLAEWLEAPVLTEQSIVNPDHSIRGYDGFLRNYEILKTLEPDFIFRFGLQPASKSLLKALENWNPATHVYVKDARRPLSTSIPATHIIEWEGKYFDANKFPKKSTDWLKHWKEVESTFTEQKKSAIKQFDSLTDGHVYEHLSPQIPDDWTLFFSNSFPARDRSLFGSWGNQKVFTNRGASGIDGITSSAIGVGIGTGHPGMLFTGDLAFLHDTNALLNHRLLSQPLIVVVINNQGGSIFRMLPIANHGEYFTPYFETPQQADISQLASAYGIPYTGISNLSQLKELSLGQLINEETPFMHVIECRTDPNASMELRRKLWNS